MLITIAICTYNRAELLRRTLEQMTLLAVPRAVAWELIVVDNNCTDETATVVSDFANRLPIRRIVEENAGLSNARNAALRSAGGEYVIWTDDDVLVDVNWLAAYASAFARHPEASIFGGPISPWFAGTTPEWLTQVASDVAPAYAVREVEDELPISVQLAPFGANMAFRRDVLGTRPFNPALGRIGMEMLGGEESAVIESLLARGCSGWWVQDAPVKHYIPAERQNTTYLRRYYSGFGATKALMSGAVEAPLLLGKPRWMWREIVTKELTYRVRRIYGSPSVWITDLKRASVAWGQFSLQWTSDSALAVRNGVAHLAVPRKVLAPAALQ